VSDIVVLDSSAILAVVFEEPGADVVLARLGSALLSTVNLSEAAAKLVERGMEIRKAREILSDIAAERIGFGEEDAWLAGGLRKPTRALGLSFGDRACLALAMQRKCPILTADRAWSRLEMDVAVEMIR